MQQPSLFRSLRLIMKENCLNARSSYQNMPGAIMLPGMHRKGLQKSRQFPWRSENDPIINYNFSYNTAQYSRVSNKPTNGKFPFRMAGQEGQLHVVYMMLSTPLKALCINLNAQYVNGMTHFDKAYMCMVTRCSRVGNSSFIGFCCWSEYNG